MNATDSMRAIKAKALRHEKPIVKDLNLESIQDGLYEIEEACAEVHWFFDDESGLLEQMIGDEDDVYEFRSDFADLEAECSRMSEDLRETWVPECFDVFFVAIADGYSNGGMLGWDSFEGDYFGLNFYETEDAVNGSREKLKRMTKDEMLDAMRQCFKVVTAWLGLRYRYDCLKAAMDILRDDNSSRLKMAKRINELYEKMDAEYAWLVPKDVDREWTKLLGNLPGEAWIA